MNTTSKVLIAIVSGIAVGAVTGILFAPDKGSQTRRKIREGTGEFGNRMKTMRDSMTGKIKVAHNGEHKKSKVEESIA